MSEEKFVKFGIKTNAVKTTPKTDPIVLTNNTNPDLESLLSLSSSLIIEINIGFRDDINTNGIANKSELAIKLPNSKF